MREMDAELRLSVPAPAPAPVVAAPVAVEVVKVQVQKNAMVWVDVEAVHDAAEQALKEVRKVNEPGVLDLAVYHKCQRLWNEAMPLQRDALKLTRYPGFDDGAVRVLHEASAKLRTAAMLLAGAADQMAVELKKGRGVLPRSYRGPDV